MWQLWIVVGWFALATILMIAQVGKPREPLDGTTAAIATCFNGALICLVLWVMS